EVEITREKYREQIFAGFEKEKSVSPPRQPAGAEMAGAIGSAGSFRVHLSAPRVVGIVPTFNGVEETKVLRIVKWPKDKFVIGLHEPFEEGEKGIDQLCYVSEDRGQSWSH